MRPSMIPEKPCSRNNHQMFDSCDDDTALVMMATLYSRTARIPSFGTRDQCIPPPPQSWGDQGSLIRNVRGRQAKSLPPAAERPRSVHSRGGFVHQSPDLVPGVGVRFLDRREEPLCRSPSWAG